MKEGELESENDVVMDAVVQVMQGNEPRNTEASRSWKRQRIGFSLGARRSTALQTPWF